MTQTNPDAAAAGEGGPAETGESDLDLDTTFHLLQTERRRLALRYLLECERAGETVVEMRDVADQVAAWEHDTTVAKLESDQRQRVYVGLYQTHLPKLDQHDVIDYEQSRGRIELQPQCRALEPYLERAPPIDASEPSADRTTDGDGAGDTQSSAGGPQLVFVAVGLLPLAVLASRIGPDVAVSGVLLAVVTVIAAVVGGGIQQYLERTPAA